MCGELVRIERRRQVEEPPRARELRHPDDVQHHHVEAGPAPAAERALEVDHEELVLFVARRAQRFRFHAHAGMACLERRDEAGHGIVAEHARVLEDDGDGQVPRRLATAAGEDDDRGHGHGAQGKLAALVRRIHGCPRLYR